MKAKRKSKPVIIVKQLARSIGKRPEWQAVAMRDGRILAAAGGNTKSGVREMVKEIVRRKP